MENTIDKDKVLETKCVANSKFNRVAYIGFVILGTYMLVKGDVLSAATNLGVSLVFDPFDQDMKWNDRPLYQRVWLFIQVIAVFGLFLYGTIKK